MTIDTKKIETVFAAVNSTCIVLFITLVLLVAGHYALGCLAYVKDLFAEPAVSAVGSESGDARENLPVYADYADKGAFWSEHKQSEVTHFEPYFHWRRDAFRGKYTNVDDNGVRRTVASVSIASDADKVFLFGGSTMWGTGTKDEHTIASLLQAKLGENYEVRNYGENGYVAAQELNYLLYLLTRGEVPDVVIFLDGVNDGYAGTYSPAIPRDPHNLRMRYLQHEQKGFLLSLYNASNYKRLVNYLSKSNVAVWDEKIAPDIKRNAKLVVDTYDAHIRQVNALAKEYGFKAYFFWQPNLFSGTRKLPDYEQDIIKSYSSTLIESQQQVYLHAKARYFGREAENIFFIGDIFNEVDLPIYIDWCHLGAHGNEILANEIANRMQM